MTPLQLKQLDEFYRSRNVLITGGLGFIGSNLAIRLVHGGANVTIVDVMIPEYGGNLFNIKPVHDDVRVNFSNICDQFSMDHLVKNQDFIFHLAGQVSHIKSMSQPFDDIEFNIKGTTVLMEACKKNNPNAIIIRAGTRGQYGPATHLPVPETAPTNPKGIYEISHLTAEKVMKVYHEHFEIRSVLLRLTNIYGPRAQMKSDQYGVANWFIRLALDNKTIKVFGDGSIQRDFLYIDDCVDALVMSGVCEKGYGEIFNVGHSNPMTFRELAETIVRVCKSGRWELTEFTPERKAQEPGNFYSDISKIRSVVGWEPKTLLKEGLEKTIDYYRTHKHEYW